MQLRHLQECGCLIDLLRGMGWLLAFEEWGCLGGIGGTRLTAYALRSCSRTGLIDALQGVWGFVWGLFHRENFMAGKFRHPWKSQSSRLPPAHPHMQAHTPFRVRTIRKNQMATESSITSQHLLLQTLAQKLWTHRMQCRWHLHCLPTALNFARGKFRHLPYRRNLPTRSSPPEIPPPKPPRPCATPPPPRL